MITPTVVTSEQNNNTAQKSIKPSAEGFKRITKGQIKEILATPQVMRSDCYLVSTLKALAKSGFGKQMLKDSIKTSADGDTFEIQFKKYGEENSYQIKKNKTYEVATSRHQFNPTGAIETATNHLINDKSDAKPFLLRTFGPLCCGSLPYEGNLASIYMESLTGKKPISLGDDGLKPLKLQKEEATKLLDKIADTTINKHSFVAGSKLFNTKDNIGAMHYYVVKKVDKNNKEVHLVNPRYFDITKGTAEKDFETDIKIENLLETEENINNAKNSIKNMPKVYKLSYEQFMNNFRSLVGYFDDKIGKNK